MREHLEPLKAAIGARWAETRLLLDRARAWVTPRAVRGAAAAKVLAKRAGALAKRTLIATLASTEKALLTHKGRERTQAVAVFTLIFAFFVTSVDFLLSGGPEFGAGAQAAGYTAHVDLISSRTGGRAEAVIELATLGPAEAAALTPEPEAVVQPVAAHVEVQADALPGEPPKARPDFVEGQRVQKDKA